MRRQCSILGCDKPVHGRGWCSTHHMRWLKHGDPLTNLRPDLGQAQRFYREVVLTDDRGPDDPCLIWPHSRYGSGYAQLGTSSVSRLACEERHGPPPAPKHDAAHSCGKGKQGCVTQSHLSWKTHKENEADKIIHGTSNRGARQGNAKLTELDVREILALKGKVPQRLIAERFGVQRNYVSSIHCRRTWAWLS